MTTLLLKKRKRPGKEFESRYVSKTIEIVCILFCVDIGIPYFEVLLYFSCGVIFFNILVHVLLFLIHIHLHIKSSNSLKCAVLSKAGKKKQEILSY